MQSTLNTLLGLGALTQVIRPKRAWLLVIFGTLATLALLIYQTTTPPPSSVTVHITAAQMPQAMDVQKVIVYFQDASHLDDAAAGLIGAAERAPNCVAHITRADTEPHWVWCDNGYRWGAYDASVAGYALAWQEGQEQSTATILARAYAWPDWGGATFTITTSGSGCDGAAIFGIPDLGAYGWHNVTSSFASYGNCTSANLHANPFYAGAMVICAATCVDLRPLGFDNNTESFKVR